ncbi:hypothetical protein QZH41_007456 [Actinostola sp. cb2023]|nr:hypothetical protein QZH41_007456 [Actinostola sp. cb2023]
MSGTVRSRKREAPQAQDPIPEDKKVKVETVLDQQPLLQHSDRFNVFKQLPINADVRNKNPVIIGPTETGNPVVFVVDQTPDFIDLSTAKVTFRVKVLHGDNSVIAHGEHWYPVNNIGCSVFSQVKCIMNNETLSLSAEQTGHLAYMQRMVFEDKNNADNLTVEGFVKDTPFRLNDVAVLNKGAVERRKWFMAGNEPWPRPEAPAENYTGTPHFEVPLYNLSDFFACPRYLVPGESLQLTFHKAPDAHFFTGDATFNALNPKFEIVDMRLHFTYLDVAPSILEGISSQLWDNNKVAIYPIKTHLIQTYLIPAGTQSWEKWNLFQNNTPNVVLFAMVTSANFNGLLTRNAYDYQLFGLRNVKLTQGAREIVGPRLEWDHLDDCVALYNTLFDVLGQSHSAHNKLIQRKEFRGGFGIFGWNLNPDGTFLPWQEVTAINTGRSGINLSLNFAAPLTANIQLLCLGQFENDVNIDGGRNVTQKQLF